MKSVVWDLLHGALWGFAAAVLVSAFMLAGGCYRGWGGQLPAPEPHPSDWPDVDASDAAKFPPCEVLEARIDFAEVHLDWLDRRSKALGASRSREAKAYRDELVRCIRTWRVAYNAVYAADVGEKLRLLRTLRLRIGVRAYNQGSLPGLPQTEYFTRVD